MNNSCKCNLDNSYCYDLYGCLGTTLIIKAGLDAGNIYDVYVEDHFGNLFTDKGITANVSGDLVVNLSELPEGLISEVSENLLVYITIDGGNTPLKISLGTDGEQYDNILLKFHGGDAGINVIQ